MLSRSDEQLNEILLSNIDSEYRLKLVATGKSGNPLFNVFKSEKAHLKANEKQQAQIKFINDTLKSLKDDKDLVNFEKSYIVHRVLEAVMAELKTEKSDSAAALLEICQEKFKKLSPIVKEKLGNNPEEGITRFKGNIRKKANDLIIGYKGPIDRELWDKYMKEYDKGTPNWKKIRELEGQEPRLKQISNSMGTIFSMRANTPGNLAEWLMQKSKEETYSSVNKAALQEVKTFMNENVGGTKEKVLRKIEPK